MTVIRTTDDIRKQIGKVAADYVREPSDRTLGYLQLLISFVSMRSKPIDYLDKPINEFPVTIFGQGRGDALKWLHGEGE